MAIFKADVDIRLDGIKRLVQLFPSLNARYLMYVGEIGVNILKHNYLSGQEIDIQGITTSGRDKKGRRMVSRKTNRRRDGVQISSYPMNFFERGRGLRGGGREAGKYVITRKLKQDIAAGIATYSRDFEKQVMETELAKMGLK